jgi:hypothetical protein
VRIHNRKLERQFAGAQQPASPGRDVTVVHGQGSVIHARPLGAGVDLGGRCVVLD